MIDIGCSISCVPFEASGHTLWCGPSSPNPPRGPLTRTGLQRHGARGHSAAAPVSRTSGEAVWHLSTGLSKPLFEALLAAFARQTGAGRRRSIVLVLDKDLIEGLIRNPDDQFGFLGLGHQWNAVCGLMVAASRLRQRSATVASSWASVAKCRLTIGSSTSGQRRSAGCSSGL